MCGITCYKTTNLKRTCKNIATKLQHRGPDNSRLTCYQHKNGFVTIFIFNRLSIMDLSENGMQPFISNNIEVICNGEIYNSPQLRQQFPDYNFVSNSDCEVLVPMFRKYGVNMFEMLDGEFSCIIRNKDRLYVARDSRGIRPLFYSFEDNEIIFSSELKAMKDKKKVYQFPPGNYWCEDNISNFISFNTLENLKTISMLAPDFTKINYLLTNAVKKRLQSDAEYGFLLSGGLDSSLVVAIARKILGSNAIINTFSIGLEDSTDLKEARKVARFLNTNHNEVVMTVEDGIDAINDVIWFLESYDQTTIYAGTYQYLLCKWISKNTNVKVLLGGELADEVCASYRYIGLAPSKEEAIKENIKLLSEVHFYDVLRADRMISANGLESRVPFSDNEFINYMLSIDIVYRMPKGNIGSNIEKYCLRKAFEGYLPEDVLWRKKEAFSDGVGISWVAEMKKKCNELYTNEEFEILSKNFIHNPPLSKDDLYFRIEYEKLFGSENVHLIPHKWIPNPNWNLNITESSARFLTNY